MAARDLKAFRSMVYLMIRFHWHRCHQSLPIVLNHSRVLIDGEAARSLGLHSGLSVLFRAVLTIGSGSIVELNWPLGIHAYGWQNLCGSPRGLSTIGFFRWTPPPSGMLL